MIRHHTYTAADLEDCAHIHIPAPPDGPWIQDIGGKTMTDKKPRRDYRGIITADILREWTGTDADLARHLDVSRQAITYARIIHKIPSTTDGRRGPRPGMSKTVEAGIVREVHRRAGRDATDADLHKHMLDVMTALNAWASVWIGGAK